jgi:CheY-like chemotaxis protein
VEEAENGKEAVELVAQNAYDLILMDVQMPIMDGREATRMIRADINKTIPIIALTANAIKGELEICKAAGMDDYISKPFDENVLLKMMVAFLSGKTPNPARPAPEELQPAKPADSNPKTRRSKPLYSLARLKAVNKNNPAFIKKMIGLFIEVVPPAVEQIRSGYDTQDFAAIARAAHKIKPVLHNFCVRGLEEEIKMIEEMALKQMPSDLLAPLIAGLVRVSAQVVKTLEKKIDAKPKSGKPTS